VVLHVNQQDLGAVAIRDHAGLLAVGVLGLLDAKQLVHLAQKRHKGCLLEPLQLLTTETDTNPGKVATLEHYPDADDEALGSTRSAAE